MNEEIRNKILRVCEQKIQQKGDTVQVSFYAFFANKNHDPALLMSVARWWIEEHQLNHFEKATKIHAMVTALGRSKFTRQGFNHLTLTVKDLDQSLAFYQQLLGFSAQVRWAQGAYLSYGNCWLCLALGESQPSQDYSHVALSYDADALQAVRDNEAFQPLTLWQNNTSEGESIYIQDPDGHKLELHSGDLSSRLASLKHQPYKDLQWLNL